MPLTTKQRAALTASPPADAVKTREENGITLSYLEGWFVIQEANRIFGTEHWDRITLSTHCVWQGKQEGRPACSYSARVRLCVRLKEETLVREGSGIGHGAGATLGEAHGHALKAAETDATKRALATLGAPFGLTLYDSQARDSAPSGKESSPANTAASGTTGNALRPAKAERHWIIRDASGEAKWVLASAISACSALRRAIDRSDDPATLDALYVHNKRFLARLAAEKPLLRDRTDRHYSEILSRLYQTRLKRLTTNAERPSQAAAVNGATIRITEPVPAE